MWVLLVLLLSRSSFVLLPPRQGMKWFFSWPFLALEFFGTNRPFACHSEVGESLRAAKWTEQTAGDQDLYWLRSLILLFSLGKLWLPSSTPCTNVSEFVAFGGLRGLRGLYVWGIGRKHRKIYKNKAKQNHNKKRRLCPGSWPR